MSTPVLDLLSDPKRWTKDTYARREDGEPVCSRSPRAVSWCIAGAITKCYPDAEYPRMHSIIFNILQKRNVELGIGGFNDDPRTTHDQVVALLKEAGI